jgi:hypothetical protein
MTLGAARKRPLKFSTASVAQTFFPVHVRRYAASQKTREGAIAQQGEAMHSAVRMSSISAAALLLVGGVSACTAGAAERAPSASVSPSSQAQPELPSQEEACDFLLGVGAQDFEDYSGVDFTGLTVNPSAGDLVTDNTNEFYAQFAPMIDRGGLFCQLEPPAAGEGVIFAWAPIDEPSREQVIADLVESGYERTESEAGTLLVQQGPSGDETHNVTNVGWYYSTVEGGVDYLRDRWEG